MEALPGFISHRYEAHRRHLGQFLIWGVCRNENDFGRLRSNPYRRLDGIMARSRSFEKPRKRLPNGSLNARRALTPRQKEILRLVAQGLTNREIAEQLDISVRTVEVHRFNLMRRLRVRNVAQLLRQALALRLLPKSFTSI
jgi:DNA-binding CsgD family transcriptional regulator